MTETENKFLTLDTDERGVAYVGLNRPEVHNAFNSALVFEIIRTVEALYHDDKVRIIVLYGHGKSFCAGGDLNWLSSMKDFTRAENINDSKVLAAMFATLRDLSKPLIGIVHGVALGGGSGLAAVCDYVVASEETRFGFTETRLGILPAVIAPYAIEKIGSGAARAYFISGMQFPAVTAREIGLIHRVVPRNELDAARDEIVNEFLKAAPRASRSAKFLIKNVQELAGNRTATTDATVTAIADARVSEEGQEGMSALLEGRKAKWVP